MEYFWSVQERLYNFGYQEKPLDLICQNNKNGMKRFMLIFTLFLFFSPVHSHASGREGVPGDTALYRLTLYVMKSIKPIVWDSPSSLFKSVRKGYISQICRKNQYLLGHLVVKLDAPENRHPVYSGMASSSKKEKRQLVMKEKVGLGILGAGMQGHLETGDTVTSKLKKYSRLEKMAFVRYLISKEAYERISEFLDRFRETGVDGFSPSSVYGGIFWPRYENEGAGCTAYGMAMVDLAGILGGEQSGWKVDMGIPFDLIGGEFNNGKKVKNRTILHSDGWYEGNPDSTSAYVPFWIYDPSLIYDWIMKKRSEVSDSLPGKYRAEMEGSIPGLVSDRRDIRPSVDDPVFYRRRIPSVFILPFYRKIGMLRGTMD
jgi:hypothetical protein